MIHSYTIDKYEIICDICQKETLLFEKFLFSDTLHACKVSRNEGWLYEEYKSHVWLNICPTCTPYADNHFQPVIAPKNFIPQLKVGDRVKIRSLEDIKSFAELVSEKTYRYDKYDFSLLSICDSVIEVTELSLLKYPELFNSGRPYWIIECIVAEPIKETIPEHFLSRLKIGEYVKIRSLTDLEGFCKISSKDTYIYNSYVWDPVKNPICDKILQVVDICNDLFYTRDHSSLPYWLIECIVAEPIEETIPENFIPQLKIGDWVKIRSLEDIQTFATHVTGSSDYIYDGYFLLSRKTLNSIVEITDISNNLFNDGCPYWMIESIYSKTKPYEEYEEQKMKESNDDQFNSRFRCIEWD